MPPEPPVPAPSPQPSPQSRAEPAAGAEPSTGELIAQLRDDQLWLLRQLDAGRWPEWRLDLAALERELDQLLNQLSDDQGGTPA